MILRPPQCDDDRCDYDTTGLWRHHAQCPTQNPWADDDMAAATATEDGYARLPLRPIPASAGTVVRLPVQRGGEAA